MADEQPTRPEPGNEPGHGQDRASPGGNPVWPDPFPSGPYASVPYPTGPYAAGLPPPSPWDQPHSVPPAPTVPLTAPVSGAGALVPFSGAGLPVVAQIGDIEVTSMTVRTPVGEFPLRGSQWTVTDQWMTSQKIPTWAILCTIFGFFCLTVFSLFFLLAKETVYSGVVAVTVRNGAYQYDTRMAVTNQAQVQHVHSLVNYARSLAAV
jgi:hypothetical protein